ncbi:MAG: hypothetical protein MUQ30_08495, partial [Anaerolineae bacterium]|nr:hypothetical protein [Anaerolineae bacterium]
VTGTSVRELIASTDDAVGRLLLPDADGSSRTSPQRKTCHRHVCTAADRILYRRPGGSSSAAGRRP